MKVTLVRLDLVFIAFVTAPFVAFGLFWILVISPIVRFDNEAPLPAFPIYPGAQQVPDSPALSKHLYDPRTLTTIFVTPDEPSEIQKFYVNSLTRDGWHYNECHFFTKSVNIWPTGEARFIATIGTEPSEDGQTRVTTTVTYGWLSCDIL